MSITLLATGDELVNGDTLNTNSQQLAHALNSEGLLLGFHLTCGDKEEEIFSAMQFLSTRHDILIITGGLGPTSDDRTRFALAKFMGVSLQEYLPATEHIAARLKRAQLPMNTGNYQQALFPPNANLLPNPLGTAMGCSLKWNNQQLFLLPGPPRECLPMFNAYVLPLLKTYQHSNTVVLKWRLFGTAEGEIAQKFDEALAKIDCETGYRLEMPYLECKVRCQKSLINCVKAIIEPLVAPHIIATPEKKASEQLAEYIGEKKISIVIIDNATGGTLQTLIQCPENFRYLTFYRKADPTFYAEIEGLESYWQKEQGSIKLTLTIRYTHHGITRTEHHELPYRSSLVLNHAAEWLSFRLYHLINALD